MAKEKILTEQEALSERLKLRIEFWYAVGDGYKFSACVQFLSEMKACVDYDWILDNSDVDKLERYAKAAEDVLNFSDAHFYRYLNSYFKGVRR